MSGEQLLLLAIGFAIGAIASPIALLCLAGWYIGLDNEGEFL